VRNRYLIQLKNELFMQGLFFSEIRDILVDTAMYFDDTQTEESAQNSILKNLGTPKEFARSIKQSNPSQSVDRIRFFRRILFFLIPLIFFIGIFFLAWERQQNINRQAVVCVLVFASIILMWFTSGNLCLFGILPVTKKQVTRWICFQFFCFLSLIILLYVMYIGVPAYIKMAGLQNTLHTVAPAVQFVTVLYVVPYIIIAVYCLAMFFKAEWLMFGIFIQSVGLICCAVFYQQYLGNLTVFDNIHYFPLPLLLSVLFSSIIYIMTLGNKGGKQNGRAD